MDDRMTISTKVTREYEKAIRFFSRKENVSLADYLRSAMTKRAMDGMMDLARTIDDKTKLAGLMKRAIDDDLWQDLAAESENTWPSTKEGWVTKIAETEAAVPELNAELVKMQEAIADLGVTMLV